MIELTYVDIINDTVKQPLQNYKYNGKDDSILYEKVISPLCQYIVDRHLPVTLAPNTITVIGFVANLIPSILMAVTDDGQPVNRFLCFFQGVMIIFYSVRVS